MSNVLREAGLAWRALLVTCVLAGSSRSANAAASGNGAAAQTLFDQAKKEMAAGHYDKACPALEESQHLEPALGTLLNLADCYEKAGRTASAWSSFLDAAGNAQKSGHPDAERVARDRAKALERRLAKLTITVTSPDHDPGLVVTRDGVSLGPAEFGVAIPVDPGSHTVGARAPGHKPWQTEVTVKQAAAASTTVPELEVVESPKPAPAPPPTTTEPASTSSAPPREAKPSHTRRTLGAVVGGVGVAAVAAGGVFAVLTKNKDGQGDSLCKGGGGGNVCASPSEKAEYEQTVSDAKRDRIISIAGFAVGAAALAAGGLLFFGASGESKHGSLRVTPIAGSDELGLLAQGRF